MPTGAAPEPAGFGNCSVCPYAGGGSAEICFDCASRTIEALPEPRCEVCEGALKPDGECGNPVCNWDDRHFDFVWAISMHTRELREAIWRYKGPEAQKGWSWIFGRVLVGYLEADDYTFGEFDLIIPSPTYVGEGGRSWDHISKIIRRAEIEADGAWPFARGVVRKTAPTKPFKECRSWRERLEVARYEIRPALEVAKPELVDGKKILVFDDVFTGGLTLNEVAGALRRHGATEVSEVVLARQPFRR